MNILSPSLCSTQPQRRYRSALLLAVACVLSGCGGGSGAAQTAASGGGGEGGTADDDPPTAADGADLTAASCADREPETAEIGLSIWQAGFEAKLGNAVLTPWTTRCAKGELVIDAQLYNRGAETHRFDAPILVSSRGNDYPLSFDSELPSVPAEREAKGSLVFPVDSKFSLRDATLIFGDGGRHQALVPLGQDSPDSLLTLEPQDLAVEGDFQVGAFTFKPDHVRVRVESPNSYDAYDKDLYEITLFFSTTYDTPLRSGSIVSYDNCSLKLPDGTSVAPDYASSEYFQNVGTTADMQARFIVKGPLPGTYSFEVTGDWGKTDAMAHGNFPFKIPELPALGATK